MHEKMGKNVLGTVRRRKMGNKLDESDNAKNLLFHFFQIYSGENNYQTDQTNENYIKCAEQQPCTKEWKEFGRYGRNLHIHTFYFYHFFMRSTFMHSWCANGNAFAVRYLALFLTQTQTINI